MNKNSVAAIPLKSIDSSTFTGSYQAINSTGIPNPCFILKITNNSSKDVTVSYDGTNDHEFVPTLSSLLLNFEAGSQPRANVALFPVGKVVYVKGAAGAGLVYLSGYYLPTGA